MLNGDGSWGVEHLLSHTNDMFSHHVKEAIYNGPTTIPSYLKYLAGKMLRLCWQTIEGDLKLNSIDCLWKIGKFQEVHKNKQKKVKFDIILLNYHLKHENGKRNDKSMESIVIIFRLSMKLKKLVEVWKNIQVQKGWQWRLKQKEHSLWHKKEVGTISLSTDKVAIIVVTITAKKYKIWTHVYCVLMLDILETDDCWTQIWSPPFGKFC